MIDSKIFIAFAEGLALILSPCILPMLPIILAASASGGKRRPLGVVAGFVLSFSAFAVLARQIVFFSGIGAGSIRTVSLVLLFALGIIMLFPLLADGLMRHTEGLARFGEKIAARHGRGDGFLSGFIIGCLVGPIWTPCAGPVMAAAVIQIIQAGGGAQTALTVLMFAIGAAVPMLAVALFGRSLMARAGFLKKHAQLVRQGLGVLLLVMVVLIWNGWDTQLLSLSNTATVAAISQKDDGKLINALAKPYPAPEISGIAQWFNSKPLDIKSLRGHVVLIDFWTYSCINCVRTLPFITKWDKDYRDHGLVIIGVHAPEFPFEKIPANVQAAIALHHIAYPVALDNNFKTWSNFNNQYWPAHYLIDKNGQVVYTHFGEGDYGVTEHNIRVLLGLDSKKMDDRKTTADTQQPEKPQTPETYLGYNRAARFDNATVRDKQAQYIFPTALPADHWALSGMWSIGAQQIIALQNGAALRLHFQGGKVFLVMGSQNQKPITLQIRIDGKVQKPLTVSGKTLYQVAQSNAGVGLLEITPERPGLEAYAFTFGE